MPFISRGMYYLHGGKNVEIPSDTSSNGSVNSFSEWKAHEDGSIPCHPKDLQGCSGGFLELRSMFPENFVSELVKRAEELADA